MTANFKKLDGQTWSESGLTKNERTESAGSETGQTESGESESGRV